MHPFLRKIFQTSFENVAPGLYYKLAGGGGGSRSLVKTVLEAGACIRSFMAFLTELCSNVNNNNNLFGSVITKQTSNDLI